jgi:hypothetical protein
MSAAIDRTAFRDAVALVAQKAHEKLPECNGRIASAVRLVLLGEVTLHADGTGSVGSCADPARTYAVNGSCDCKDYDRAPGNMCKHRLAYGIMRRALEMLPGETTTAGALEAPVEAPHGIDPRHIVLIQGRPFIKFAGLLDLAHKRGLQGLKVEWTYNDAELSLAHAVAVFPFGTFEESGDASPENVNRKVAPHFRRCALTRAAARVLRVALGLDMVAAEELAED